MSAIAEGPEGLKAGLIPAEDFYVFSPDMPRMRGRWIFRPDPSGHNYAISEWELTAAGYSDLHPHDEVSLVLEGELHIEVNGVEVVGRAGDTIRVPAGSVGRYWAPRYARMFGVYGPNPDGAESQSLSYWEIDEPTLNNGQAS
jgi:quercetin dioxygenase-like cupin family protein